MAEGIDSLAAGTTEALFAPLERIQVLLGHDKYNDRLKNTRHAFAELRPYGLKEYYRGSCFQ